MLLDPFTCQSLSREALEEALLPYRGEREDLPLAHFLQAATPRQVLARMLRNLKEIHRSAGDWQRLLAVQQRLLLLLPGEAREWRDRGLVLEELGHWQGAASGARQAARPAGAARRPGSHRPGTA